MSTLVEMTFVPSGLVPAGGEFVVWSHDFAVDDEALVAALAELALPAGRETVFPTVEHPLDQRQSVDRHARAVPVFTALRALAALPAFDEWAAWRRPSHAVLAWSAAAKLALELVAAGRLIPHLNATAVLDEGTAFWQAVPAGDERIGDVLQALPFSGHALRRDGVRVWTAERLMHAFFDATADACGREGRRPETDPRRANRAPSDPEALVKALTSADPVYRSVRLSVEDAASDVATWTAPLRDHAGDDRFRLGLVVTPGNDDHWWCAFQLRSTTDKTLSVPASELWQTTDLAAYGFGINDAPTLVMADAISVAARFFTPLDRALDDAQPIGVSLSLFELAALIDTGREALATAGVRVELPVELAGIDERRLRLQLRVGQGTATPRRSTDALLDGFDGLTGLTFTAVIGDTPLTAEDVATLTMSGKPLVRWRGQWVRIDDEQLAQIRERGGEHIALGLTEALAAALSGQYQDRELGIVDVVVDPVSAEALDRLRSVDTGTPARLKHLSASLRPYQERGIAWLQRLTDNGFGAVLADQMGLGKTLQAIAVLTARPLDRPHLVVAPTSVVGNWAAELARFAPTMTAVHHHGPDRSFDRATFGPGSIVVTSYALLRQDIGLLASIPFDVVVFDEAQQIKNPAAKAARAARELDTRCRLALTGTPIENRLSELWAILDLVNPGLLGSQRRFNERFGVPIERWGDADASARLRRMIAPFVLRRKKDDPDVFAQLPPKQERTVACLLSREQQALYRDTVERAFSGAGLSATAFERRGQILALLTALKQICNHPHQYLRDGDLRAERSGKLLRATDIIGEVLDDGERMLIFTQFRQMGNVLVEHIRNEFGVADVPFLHGGTPLAQRNAMISRFQDDPDAPPVFVVSLRAGGLGVNLTRATHVMHYDRWWNPAVEDQATDRAHRIGQTKTVTVHAMVTTGTVEERIAELLVRKRSLADAVVEAGETWITELDDDELFALVALSNDFTDDSDTGQSEDTPAIRPILSVVDGGRL
ncbi:MAG: DEAD/DEAH box helicase [Nitriliruptoraceae bacterium]